MIPFPVHTARRLYLLVNTLRRGTLHLRGARLALICDSYSVLNCDTYLKLNMNLLGVCVLVLFSVRVCYSQQVGDEMTEEDFETDSEIELNRMLSFVRPLMGILRSNDRIRNTTRSFGSSWMARAINNRYNPNDRNDRYGGGGGGGYGEGYGGGGYGGGGYGGGCYGCDEKTDYLGLISLISLGLLFLFLITLLSTTTGGKRRKRSQISREDGNSLDGLEHLLDEEGIGTILRSVWP